MYNGDAAGTTTLRKPLDTVWGESDYVEAAQASVADRVSRSAAEYGADAFVVSDAAWETSGKSYPIYTKNGQIYMRESLNEDEANSYIAHEGTHIMKQSGYAPYVEFMNKTPEKLNMSSKLTQQVVDIIAKRRGIDISEMSENDVKKLYDELCATAYGDYQYDSEKTIELYSEVFQDFDEFINQMNEIHTQFKNERKAQNGRRFEVSTSGRGVDGSLYGGERGQGSQGIRAESSGETSSEHGQNIRRSGEVASLALTFGENGSKAFQMVLPNATPEQYEAFAVVYNASLNGRELTPGQAQKAAVLPTEAFYAAEISGRNDRSRQGKKDKGKLTHKEEGAVLAYKGGGSYLLNAKLRAKAELDADEQKIVEDFDAALESIPDYEGTLYRNIGFDIFGGKEVFDEFVAEHGVGTIVKYPAYTSSSKSIDGYPVDNEYSAHIVIRGKNGKDISQYGIKSEEEVTFARNTQFFVVSVESDGKTANIVLEEVVNENRGNQGLHKRNSGGTETRESVLRDRTSEVQQVREENKVDVRAVPERNTKGDIERRAGVSGIRAEANGQITRGEENNAKEIHLRRGGERNNGSDTTGKIRSVESGSRRNQSRETQGRPADSGAASLTLGEEVSPASLGIAGGTRNKSIRLVTGGTTEKLSSAKALAKKRGLRLVPFAGGNLEIRGENGENIIARAYISGDRMFVRVDHPSYDAYQLTRHEVGHDMIDKGEINLDDVRERIDGKKLDRISDLYAMAYAISQRHLLKARRQIFLQIRARRCVRRKQSRSRAELRR